MREARANEERYDPGLRRAERREQQRRKARQGMRIGSRPDGLHPVTVRRVKKLTRGR